MVQQHELLLGTHTSPGEQNYLMVATCILPASTEVAAVTDNNTSNNTDEATTTTTTTAATPATTTLRYDDERKELGGYGDAGADVGKIEIRMKIKHEGEVNRCVS